MKRENSISSLSQFVQSKWQSFIVLLSLLAICIYLILRAANSGFANFPLLALIIIGGIPLFLQIFLKLLNGNFGADSLAAIALVTGVILQQYLAASLIILMLASGQTLERYARHKASSVLLALVKRMPTFAHRKIDGDISDIPVADIHINDEIVIYPHETCPVDGIVIEGNGSMDESYLIIRIDGCIGEAWTRFKRYHQSSKSKRYEPKKTIRNIA
ncbi:hypothetical protein [Legionella genomosp. 1]|uniref:P-type ATPase n=1 Tax=Legionella genomosp. 1 TaxID=1093625 RepID=UPI0021CB5BED|nr:hypothetical protein [Legionella genomosp. 1]